MKQKKIINIDADEMVVTIKINRYKRKSIILSTGSKMRNLSIPEEEKFVEKGVSHYVVDDLKKSTGKRVLVVGGGNTTAKSTPIAKTKASGVILVHRRETMRAYLTMVKRLQKEGIKIHYNIEVKERIKLKN